MKKKVGRPTAAPRNNQLRIRLNDTELTILNECCKKAEVTKTEIIVRGIMLEKERLQI